MLHLRENKLHKLDGFTEDLKNLTYLNLRRNSVKQLRQLRKLKCLPKLDTLILIDNPIMNKRGDRMGEEEEEEELEGEEEKKDFVRINILVLLPK